jgi:hypothetical protein
MSEEREEEDDVAKSPTGEKPEAPPEPAEDEVVDSIDPEEEERMRKLLRGALGGAPREESDESHVLTGVQKRIRERSGGKFYADGWSTSKQSPTYTYLYTSLVMLLIVGVVYSFLSSLSDEAAEVDNTPAPVPVRIVFPKK